VVDQLVNEVPGYLDVPPETVHEELNEDPVTRRRPLYNRTGFGPTGWTFRGRGTSSRTAWSSVDESHHLAKVRVAGSNPVFRSRELPARRLRSSLSGGREVCGSTKTRQRLLGSSRSHHQRGEPISGGHPRRAVHALRRVVAPSRGMEGRWGRSGHANRNPQAP
jgi:hypothetical protein